MFLADVFLRRIQKEWDDSLEDRLHSLVYYRTMILDFLRRIVLSVMEKG
jgi:hypothetical protein